ncbi:MAG: aminomethyl-transferring glycine dehydrogenase subunit GcvPA [Clostridiaceae bacterium]|nr:aminomethyl-transferring glycine dehydrogenase subunit GcvPA [Clostridiaceae bacterium]
MKSPYIPATSEQREAMLKTLNLSSIDELFSAIPDKLKLKEDLKLPGPYSEYELKKEFQSLIRKNSDAASNTCFLGAGVYDHIIPSAVNHIIGRQEFYTSYTPYQAEISQGVLQAMFEYQTMIAELTGMDASNASVYDGASALYEAVLLAARYNNRSEVVVARSVNPEYRKTLSSVLRYSGITVREVGFNIDNDFGGTLDMSELSEAISENTAAVVVQSPNFFGILEDIKSVSEKAKEKRALLICVCDPISLAVFEAPGSLGADIAVGEAQPLGIPMSFGGPLLGYFAVKKPFIRRMPGRVVGQTTDTEGRRGYVLTLQAREQHIRREKATSNICTNQALCALAATVYLSLMGKRGLTEVASQCIDKSIYAYNTLLATDQVTEVFKSPFFREFVVKPKVSPDKLNKELLNDGIIGGYDLSGDYPELDGCWLVAVTEKRTKAEIDMFSEKVKRICQGGV